MDKPVIVEIYGIGSELTDPGCPRLTSGADGDESCVGGCGNTGGCSGTGGCDGCCRSGTWPATRTVGSLYHELEERLEQSKLSGQVQLRFIDLFVVDIDIYPTVRDLVADGYEPPLILIDGSMRYYDGLDVDKILTAIQVARSAPEK